MKSKHIRRWVSGDLAGAQYFKNKDGSTMSLPERLAIALDDPGFGWRLARAEVLAGKRLPYSLKSVNLLRAQEYLVKRDSRLPAHLEDYVMLDTLTHPLKKHEREVLNALLISRDITLSNIALRMGLPQTVIEVYADLCFSVRDRSNDQPFLARIVYPPDQQGDLSRELSLLRAGYKHGAVEVLVQAGWSRSRLDESTSTDFRDEIECEVMEQALTDVRAGCLDSAAVKHALKQLTLRAEKEQWNGSGIPDSVMGLQAVGIGYGIIDTVKRIQGPEIQKRLHLPEKTETTNSITALVNGSSTT